MSIQRRILITPPDIVAIDYECSHCNARYTIPINKIDRNLIKTCPNCQEQWLKEENFSVQVVVQNLKKLQDLYSGATVRLELSEPLIPDSEILGKPKL